MTKHVRTPAGPGLRRAQSRCNLWPQMCSCLIKPAKPTCLVVVVVVVARHPGRLARTRASDLYAQTNASAERPMTSSAARRKHFVPAGPAVAADRYRIRVFRHCRTHATHAVVGDNA